MKNISEAHLESASPQARGKRVRRIREDMLRYSRDAFGKKYDIPAPTLQNWEIGKYGGLTERGAVKLTKAFNMEGIPCTLEWLLYGLGEQIGNGVNAITPDANSSITQELCLFHQLNPSAVDAIVMDDGMEPCFTPGDHVAGIRHFGGDIDKNLGSNCIIQTTAGEVLIRKLSIGMQADFYNLSCINSHTQVIKPMLKNVGIFSVAAVIWFRRPIKF